MTHIDAIGLEFISGELQDRLFGDKDDLSRATVTKWEAGSVIKEIEPFGLDIPSKKRFNLPESLPYYLPIETLQDLPVYATEAYKYVIEQVTNFLAGDIPAKPSKISRIAGWAKYQGGSIEAVECPPSGVCIFDVETLVKFKMPVMAALVSNEAWYFWLHPMLASAQNSLTALHAFTVANPDYLIPLAPNTVVINHAVTFDFGWVKQSYNYESNLLGLDTMSMHIALRGMSHKQRDLFEAWRNGSIKYTPAFAKETSFNNLVDVHNLHVRHLPPMQEGAKDLRDIFVESNSLAGIEAKFDELTQYNLEDIFRTFHLAKVLWPKYLRHSSIVSIIGHMLQTRSKLYVRKDWNQWLEHVDNVYNLAEGSLSDKILDLAKSLIKEWESGEIDVENDPHFSQLDWSTYKSGRFKGKPKWFGKFWNSKEGRLKATTKSSLVPLLLKLSWEGSPLIYDSKHKWIFESDKANSKITIDGKHYRRVPHKKGDTVNCGNPLGKDYIDFLESGQLASGLDSDVAKDLIKATVSVSYWVSYRKRANNYKAVQSPEFSDVKTIKPFNIPHGTCSRRVVESCWLTASGAKKNKIGTELKAMVRAPKGHKLVGADMDSEEMKIAAMFADAFRSLKHGSTPIGFAQIIGDKNDGTDPHTLLANKMGIDRQIAKVMNFENIYLSGAKSMGNSIKNVKRAMPIEECIKLAQDGITFKRGRKIKGLFLGGSDSDTFNFNGAISTPDKMPPHLQHLWFTDYARSPMLGVTQSKAIWHSVNGNEFATSRFNWSIQTTGVDIMHMFMCIVDRLCMDREINAQFALSIHDEFWYYVPDEQVREFTVIFQIAHVYTWAYLAYRLGFSTIPLSYIYFSATNVDTVLRKEINYPVSSPSNDETVEDGLSLSPLDVLVLAT